MIQRCTVAIVWLLGCQAIGFAEYEPSAADKPVASADALRQALGDIDPAIRAAAAAKLRESYVPPDRQPWDELLRAIQPGDTRQQLHAKLTPEQAHSDLGVGSGPNYMEEYRLDDRWMLRCWFRIAGDVLFDISLSERMREAWVAPPENYSGDWITYFVNGQPAHEIEYRDGQYHGKFIAFHPTGGRNYVQHYQNGEANGWDTGYYPSGQVSYRGLYQAGKQVGVWTWYNEDGAERDTERHSDPAETNPPTAAHPPAATLPDGDNNPDGDKNQPSDSRRPSKSPPTGTLVGRFLFDGDPPQPALIEGVDRDNYGELSLKDQSLLVGPDRGIQNIIVWISDKNLPVPPPAVEKRLPAPARLTFRGGLFQPRVLAFEARRGLLLGNDDAVPTNAQWDSLSDGQFNRLLQPGETHQHPTPPQKLPSRLNSNLHNWAQAWLFPSAHPYVAVTDDRGAFEIARIPPGDWEFRAWHERWGYIRFDPDDARSFRFRIQPGSNDLGIVVIRPSETGDSAAALPGERQASIRDWRKIRAGRIEAHDRDQAAGLVGAWKLTLPAGFTYDIDITQRADGLLVLDCRTKINLLGVYAFSDGQLRLVETVRDGQTDLVWDDRDGTLLLIGDERAANGASYLGATLERMASVAD
jgi:hypothetical protein